MSKQSKWTEFLSEVGYYTMEVATFVVLFCAVFVVVPIAVVGPIWLAIAPMQVSLWWGLVSIPGTILLIGTIIALWNRKRGDY